MEDPIEEMRRGIEALEFAESMAGHAWEQPEPCACPGREKEQISHFSSQEDRERWLWSKVQAALLKADLHLVSITHCRLCYQTTVRWIPEDRLRSKPLEQWPLEQWPLEQPQESQRPRIFLGWTR